MDPETVLMGIVAGIAGYISYLAFQRSGLLPALIVFSTVMLLFASLRNGIGIGIWGGLSNLTNPFIMAFMGFFLGFTYAVFELPQSNPWIVGFATLFIAGVTSIVIFNFWNIGG